jgi:phage terminase Nu1 subunit (DNA packaging protein)
MATNYEMIEEMAMLIGYEFNGLNLKTFAEWAKEGMIVQKGEKAIMQLELWKPFIKKIVDENNKPVIDEKTGKQKEETHFKLVMSSLFAEEQVKAGELKKKATTKKKAAPKKKKEKHTFVRVGA